MNLKAYPSPLVFGLPTLLAGIAFLSASASAAIAQHPSPGETDSPRGRRAAALYKVSTTPLTLTEVHPPVSEHESKRFRQTQRAYIFSPLVLQTTLAQPDVASLSVFRESPDKVGWLKEHLLVTFPGDGDIMEIAVADAKASKEDLLALTNAVSKAYFDEVIFREQSERTLPLQILTTSLRMLSGQVRDKMDTLRQLELDQGFDAASSVKRQWLKDESWLLRQRIEELRTQHFDEKMRRLQTDSDSEDVASAKETESKRAAIDGLFADEERRLKAQLEETQAATEAAAPELSTDLDLRREEIEMLREHEKCITRRIQLLQIEMQAPNRVHAIGAKGNEWGAAEFYEK